MKLKRITHTRTPEEAAAIEPFIATILAAVTEWDVTDEAGQPIPITREAVTQLPDDFLRTVVKGMIEDAMPPSPRLVKAN